LKAIQEQAMEYQETKYEISIIIDALKAMKYNDGVIITVFQEVL